MNRPPQCLEFTDSTTSQFAIVLRPHTPLLLFASLAACQPPRASGFEVRAGCPRARLLLPCLGFTHPECQEGCPVSPSVHFNRPSHRRRFLALLRQRETAFVSATSGCPQLLGLALLSPCVVGVEPGLLAAWGKTPALPGQLSV